MDLFQRLLGNLPGVALAGQAWDATKLFGRVVAQRRERAVVLAAEAKAMAKKVKEEDAHKELKQLFENEQYQEAARLFLPDKVVDFALEASDVYWRVWDLYWILALARIVFALYQPGYIHPDEYFQSVEVLTGDVFGLDVTRTWEFNATSPLRSMTLPMVIIGGPLYAYKGVAIAVRYYTEFDIITPYLIWLIPRMVMLALSFVVDVCVYKICVLYKDNFNQCLVTLASSYVMLVYATRTFSNSVELVLLALLMYMVAKCMHTSAKTVQLEELVQRKHDKAETTREKVVLIKQRKMIPAHDYKYFLLISVLCAVGFFNRPTFVIFALIPLFHWFQRGIANDAYFTPNVMLTFRFFSLLPVALLTASIIVLIDSLYYGDLTLWKLWELTMDWSDWKCCPLNFIMYNVVPGNLDKHGTHPFYLHALINIPLLFGPLGMAVLIAVLNYIMDILTKPWKEKPGLNTVYAMTLFTFVFSLGLLSIFPHQEPRFLIPLLVPSVLLASHKLRFKPFANRKTPFKTMWYFFNIGMLLLYGYIHQAGVYPTVRYIGSEHQFSEGTREANFVWSNTYMPPKFPLHQSRRLDKVGDVRKHFHDLAGASLLDVHSKLMALSSRARYFKKVKGIETYVIIPSHLMPLLEEESKGALTFTEVYYVFPHLSTENMPMMDTNKLTATDFFQGMIEVMQWLRDFSLSTYRVKLGDVSTVEMTSESPLSEAS